MGEEHHPAPDARITGDGRFVVAAAIRQYDESYAVFDLDAGRSWLAPDGAFREISIFPRGRGFLSVDSDYRVVRWAFSPATWLRPVPAAGPVARSREGWSGPWHFSPDGRRMLTVSHRDIGAEKEVEQRVVVLDTTTLRAVRQWSYRPGNASLIGRVAPVVQEPVFHAAPTCAVAPDNRTVAVTSSDSPRVRLFDLTTGTELRPFAGHAAAVVTVRRAGSKLISVGSDRVARAWQLPDLARGVRGREIEVFDPWGDDDLPPSPAAGARFKVLYDRDRNRVEARDVETEAIVWEREVPGLPVLQPDRPRTIPTAIDPVWDRIAFAVGPAVTVCDLLTGETVAEVRVPGCWPTAVEFGPQPDTLFVGYHDGQVLVWDLRPRDLPRRPPTDAEFAALWADLGGSPRAAARTRSGFLDDPALTLRWLDAHLRPLERPTDLDIDLWLARLAHPRFAEREEATRLLVRHFDVAGPAVREMLVTTRSTEVEHRLRMVIDRQANLGGDAEVVRLVRAVTFLERLGAPEAARLLARLARGGGVPAVRAAEALVRMKERDKAKSVNQPQSMTAPGASAGR